MGCRANTCCVQSTQVVLEPAARNGVEALILVSRLLVRWTRWSASIDLASHSRLVPSVLPRHPSHHTLNCPSVCGVSFFVPHLTLTLTFTLALTLTLFTVLERSRIWPRLDLTTGCSLPLPANASLQLQSLRLPTCSCSFCSVPSSRHKPSQRTRGRRGHFLSA